MRAEADEPGRAGKGRRGWFGGSAEAPNDTGKFREDGPDGALLGRLRQSGDPLLAHFAHDPLEKVDTAGQPCELLVGDPIVA